MGWTVVEAAGSCCVTPIRELPRVPSEEVTDVGGDLVTMGFESEVPGIEKMQLGVGEVTLVRGRLLARLAIRRVGAPGRAGDVARAQLLS